VPHLAAGERATAVEYGGEGIEGIFVKLLKLPGACVHKDSKPFFMCWLKLVKSV
jgi:hypothetical protein